MNNTIVIAKDEVFIMFSFVLTLRALYVGNKVFEKANATREVETDVIIVTKLEPSPGLPISDKVRGAFSHPPLAVGS